jgi:hypothetical protein
VRAKRYAGENLDPLVQSKRSCRDDLPLAFPLSCGFLQWFALALRMASRDWPGSSNSACRSASERPDQCNFLMATERREKSTLLPSQVPTLAWHGRGLHRSSGRSERLMRVTTGSQARFSRENQPPMVLFLAAKVAGPLPADGEPDDERYSNDGQNDGYERASAPCRTHRDQSQNPLGACMRSRTAGLAKGAGGPPTPTERCKLFFPCARALLLCSRPR